MSDTDGNGFTVVDDVVVVRRSNFGWQCLIAGRPVFVGSLQVPQGFHMPVEGKRGRVILTEAAVRDLDLPMQLVRQL